MDKVKDRVRQDCFIKIPEKNYKVKIANITTSLLTYVNYTMKKFSLCKSALIFLSAIIFRFAVTR